ncbi:MAG: hypothetical protein RLN76_07620 [Phycisphaeraceae bacterium]
MIDLRQIHPVSGFVRDPKSHIKRLRETGLPEVLTLNGKASVVVQDAAAYQKLLDELEALDSIRVLRDRLAVLKAGEPGVSAEALFEQLRGDLESKRS